MSERIGLVIVPAEQFGGELTIEMAEEVVTQLSYDPDFVNCMIVIAFQDIEI